MSSNINHEEHDPTANLTMQPVRGILKTSKSTDQSQSDGTEEMTSSSNNYQTTGMTRSESKSHKIPHFDEMNIIATYHPIDKDYGHMKIDEPKTPYAPGENIDEEMETETNDDETTSPGVDPDALTQKLYQSSGSFHLTRRSIDENAVISPEDEEHRRQFENHRKKHYNEFEMARLHKKEIEDELRALEQEEALASNSEGKEKKTTSSSSSNDSIKPILVHDHSSHHHHQQHVHVEDDPQHQSEGQELTPEEQEKRKQFELKRKKHYDEFRVAHSTEKDAEK